MIQIADIYISKYFIYLLTFKNILPIRIKLHKKLNL